MTHHFQAPASRSLRRSVAISMMALCGILIAMPAAAQELDPNSPPPVRDYVSCGHSESQIDAQAVLDSGTLNELGRQSLDGDGDGIACEEAFGLDPNSPPPALDYTSCGHFESQQSAQEVLDAGLLEDPSVLDGDGDGIACEDAFDSAPATDTASTPATTVRLPNTGSGVADGASAGIGTLALALLLMSGGALTLRRHLATR